ncbi:MAG: hemolysin family protein [Clostridia bacterium]|nr:hemolysin family protein [Clostridia bacterium]
MDPLPALLLQIVLLILSALFTSAEVALISYNDYRIKALAEDGDKRAVKLLSLSRRESKVIGAVQSCILLCTVLAGAYGAWSFVKYFPFTEAVSAALLALIIATVTAVFGEMVPKRLALKDPDKHALALTPFIGALRIVLTPLTAVINAVSYITLRLFGINPHDEAEKVTEEEIRMMVDIGSEKGVIAPEEKVLIQNIFEFDNMRAENVMTHRTEVAVLMEKDTPQEWEKIVRDTGYSRFPVCGENIDDIVGVLHARELYEFLYDGSGDAKSLIRPPYVVPETVATDVLFRNMQREKSHMAIVVDEYGGFSGIVTLDDLLEEIVGEMDDESDGEEDVPEIIRIDENTWKVSGTAPLDELEEEMGVTLPTDEFDTLGGLVYDKIDYVPDDGAMFDVETDGISVHVIKIQDRRIERAIVKKLPPHEEDNSGKSEKEKGAEE